MFSLGIDLGSTSTKAIVFDGNRIINSIILPTGINLKETANLVRDKLLKEIKGEVYIVSTGYGRDMVDFANKKITEITCHGKGAFFLHDDISGVIDIGGQDSKAIELDRYGNIVDFIMNDKCAAGTGKFIEMMMNTLRKDIHHIDEFIKLGKPAKISSMCTVFAESEIVSLLAAGEKPENIALGVVESICSRMRNFTGKLNLNGKVFFSGGLAISEEIRRAMAKHTGYRIVSNPLCQMTGAIGAAVIGYSKISR